MSRGRLSFNLQDEEAMKKLRDYLGGEYVRGKGKRVEKDKEHSSSKRDMRVASEAL